MTPNGVYQVIRDRAEQAGLGHIKPHQFRHTYAHQWLANGGGESDLMRLTGWQSRSTVLQRYRVCGRTHQNAPRLIPAPSFAGRPFVTA